jgi:ADP-ribose pyrophosphatase YjhB (NUDIX family)
MLKMERSFTRKAIKYKKKVFKSGMFIYDNNQDKVLLVQSRGRLWGFPKGSVNQNESLKDGAVREVSEETGLIISANDIGNIVYKPVPRSTYYFIYKDECRVSTSSTGMTDNDATGIGWMHMNCIEQLYSTGLLQLTSPCLRVLKLFTGRLFTKQ